MPGSPDLVDVDFKIKEGLPGQFGGSLGYSATYGVTLGGNFVHSNFMGTGNRLVGQSAGRQVPEGLRRELYGRVSNGRRSVAPAIVVVSRQQAVHVHGFAVLDDDAVGRHQLGLPDQGIPEAYASASRTRRPISRRATRARTQARAWVLANGGQTIDPSPGIDTTNVQEHRAARRLGIRLAQRDAVPDPRHALRAELHDASVPESDVEYYIAGLDFTKYMHLVGRWLFRINSNVSYGEPYGNSTT